MILLAFALVLVEVSHSVDFGRNFLSTRNVLGAYKIAQDEGAPRSLHACYPNQEDVPEDNNFLGMVNFMEYVQMTDVGRVRQEDAFRFFNISTAALEYNNTAVAQESMARATGALRSYNARRRRESGDVQVRHKRDVWNPADLFAEFKNRMGQTKFEELLHLNKKVAMAFVIDTSSSMQNDMAYVREYIQHLLREQEAADVSAVYIVQTFGDPAIGPTKVYRSKTNLLRYLDNLQSRIGGDCQEKTCQGMLSAMYNPNFNRKGNAAMYVFTDAGSKDCAMQATVITRTLQFTKASAYFILFDSCRPNIDPRYVQIASQTGGFCLLIREHAVFNITDTVNGAFESDAIIAGEDSSESNSVVGQGAYLRSRRSVATRSIDDNSSNGHHVNKNIMIDDLTLRFKVTFTISPAQYLDSVELQKPVGGHAVYCSDDKIGLVKSVADNGAVYEVNMRSCSCSGNWTLTYPSAADEFTYTVKSIGEYSLAFESYFVNELMGSRVANYAPCLGIEEYLVIKLNQGEQIESSSLSAKIVGLAGGVVYWQAALLRDQEYSNTYIVKLVIPSGIGTDGFRVVLEGNVLGTSGSRFERQSSRIFYPTTSCLRLTDVTNYYALFPQKRTDLTLELTNNNPSSDVYSIVCSNTENYPILVGGTRIYTPGKRGFRKMKSNPIVLEAGDQGVVMVTISAPASLHRGRTVSVNCRVTTTTDELIEVVRLTEMEEKFYD